MAGEGRVTEKRYEKYEKRKFSILIQWFSLMVIGCTVCCMPWHPLSHPTSAHMMTCEFLIESVLESGSKFHHFRKPDTCTNGQQVLDTGMSSLVDCCAAVHITILTYLFPYTDYETKSLNIMPSQEKKKSCRYLQRYLFLYRLA